MRFPQDTLMGHITLLHLQHNPAVVTPNKREGQKYMRPSLLSSYRMSSSSGCEAAATIFSGVSQGPMPFILSVIPNIMAIRNLLLLSQLTGYIIALILSLCITIPMSLHQDEFKGHCLLFSTGEWQESDGQFVVKWASQAFCNYTIFVGVILFVSSAFQIYRMSVFVYKGTDSSFLSAFLDVIICLLLCLMTMIASLIVTLGFTQWCNEMIRRFPSCDLAAGNAIDKQDGIDTTGFYIEIGVAQFAVWASWATWVGLSVWSILKLCRYHQLENIKVSMYRERQRLINEGAGTSFDSGNFDENAQAPQDDPSGDYNYSRNAIRY